MRTVLSRPVKVVPLCIAALLFFASYLCRYPFAVKVLLYPLYREYKRCAFMYDRRSSESIATENFRIYCSGGCGPYLGMIAANAEESLNRVKKDLKYDPDERINLAVYSAYGEMAKMNGLGSGGKAMGVYLGGTISVLSPREWIGAGGNAAYIFEKEGPMVHELTHYVLDRISSGNIPIWFTEGAALYEEYRLNGTVWASGVAYDGYYSPRQLRTNFSGLDEVKAYKQSYLIVKYIGDNYGIESITGIANELGKGYDMSRAVRNVLRIGEQELFAEGLKDR